MLPEQAVLHTEPLHFTEMNSLKFRIKNAVDKTLNAMFQQCHFQTQGA